MKNKFLLTIILFTIVSISVVSAENTNYIKDTNNTFEVQTSQHILEKNSEYYEKNMNDTKIISQDHYTSYGNNIKKYSLNKNYSSETKDISQDWMFDITPNKGFSGNKTNISIKIIDYSGKTINSGSFDFYFNDNYIGNSPIKNNISSLTYTIPNDYEGYYWMHFNYIDKNNQKTEIDALKDITIYSKDSIILESNLKDKYPLNVEKNINIYLKNYKDNIMNKSGIINFSISYALPNDKSYGYNDTGVSQIGSYVVENGICNFNFTLTDEYPWSLDYYPIHVTFNFVYHDNNTDKNYYFSKELDIMNYEDMQTHTFISGVDASGYAGNYVKLYGSVMDENNNPVENGRIVLKLNGRTIKSNLYLNNSNKFSYNFKIPDNYSAKNYNITYVYVANDDYKRSEAYNTLIVKAKPTSIIANNVLAYAGETVTFSGNVFDVNNNPVKEGRVVIKLNGRTIKSDIYLNNSNKFDYNYVVPNYSAKKYLLTYVYINNKNYVRSELNKTFTIMNQSSKITANSIESYKDKTIRLTVKIVGAETGINAIKGTVGFKLNGQTVKINNKAFIQNISDGKAVFEYKIPSSLKADKYQIMVTYSGGRNLLGARINTSTLTIKDKITMISLKIPKSKSGDIVRILASVNDSVGKVKSGNATFKLNNIVIGTSNISAGAAVLYYKIPNDFLGKYIIEVFAKGTYTNLNSTKSTLTVVN